MIYDGVRSQQNEIQKQEEIIVPKLMMTDKKEIKSLLSVVLFEWGEYKATINGIEIEVKTTVLSLPATFATATYYFCFGPYIANIISKLRCFDDVKHWIWSTDRVSFPFESNLDNDTSTCEIGFFVLFRLINFYTMEMYTVARNTFKICKNVILTHVQHTLKTVIIIIQIYCVTFA